MPCRVRTKRLLTSRNHEAIEQFPRTVEELKEYDVVVFSDMGADTLLLPPAVLLDGQVRSNPLVSVREFVRQGGGFLMVGGYMSFSGFLNGPTTRTPLWRRFCP